MMLDVELIVARFVHYSGVLALFGIALFPVYALGHNAELQDVLPAMRLSRAALAYCALLAAVSGIAWFAFAAAGMAGDASQALNPVLWSTVLQSTAFGPLWAGRLVVLILAGMLLIRWPRGATLWLLPLLAGIAVASLAGTGHAQSREGWLRTAHEVSDALHLFAAGTWLGGLLPLGFVLTGLRREIEGDAKAFVKILQRFSATAMAAVGLVVASGLFNAWLLVGNPVSLITTAYGLALCVKLVLFVGMFALAAVNRFWISPQLDGANPASGMLHRLSINIVLEQLLGLGVIAAVSVLGTLPPPAM